MPTERGERRPEEQKSGHERRETDLQDGRSVKGAGMVERVELQRWLATVRRSGRIRRGCIEEPRLLLLLL